MANRPLPRFHCNGNIWRDGWISTWFTAGEIFSFSRWGMPKLLTPIQQINPALYEPSRAFQDPSHKLGTPQDQIATMTVCISWRLRFIHFVVLPRYILACVFLSVGTLIKSIIITISKALDSDFGCDKCFASWNTRIPYSMPDICLIIIQLHSVNMSGKN